MHGSGTSGIINDYSYCRRARAGFYGIAALRNECRGVGAKRRVDLRVGLGAVEAVKFEIALHVVMMSNDNAGSLEDRARARLRCRTGGTRQDPAPPSLRSAGLAWQPLLPLQTPHKGQQGGSFAALHVGSGVSGGDTTAKRA